MCVCITSHTQGGLTSVELLAASEPHQEKNAEKKRHEHLHKWEEKKRLRDSKPYTRTWASMELKYPYQGIWDYYSVHVYYYI